MQLVIQVSSLDLTLLLFLALPMGASWCSPMSGTQRRADEMAQWIRERTDVFKLACVLYMYVQCTHAHAK